MLYLVKLLMAAVTGQALPPPTPAPPRTREYPLAPQVPPSPPQPTLPPPDLPIVAMPRSDRMAGPSSTDGLARLSLTLDAQGRVTDCRPAAGESTAQRDVAACRVATELRFRRPPAATTGPLPIAVRFAGGRASIERATAGTPPKIDPAQQLATPEDYPPAAIRANTEGRTVVTVFVSPRGTASDCFVIDSSGSIDLDDATCRVALRVRYIPARDAWGEATAADLRIPISWSLPAYVPPADAAPPGT